MSERSTDARGFAVRLQAVTKTYGEGDVAVHALRGVDLEIARGEFVVILGPSGSGKTTLMNIAGAIERPTAGSVLVPGYDLTSVGAGEAAAYRREHIGFVFQFFNLIATLTALENVQLIADLAGADGEARSVEALRAVGLGEKLHRFPSQLSGGEQQRVAIARAVVKRPALLLADEPTGSLDLETGRTVLALLHRLGRESERTVMLVTHNAAIARMADRVVRMRSGRIIADERVTSPEAADAVTW
jgi:putative ABC transport system ATP-binding protein